VRPFQELDVWRLAHELTLSIYTASAAFPAEERFGLQSQMRRSAASVPANIAEGSAHSNDGFRRYLRIALASATELEYHLILAQDLNYLDAQLRSDRNDRLTSVKRMLQSLIQRVGELPRAKSQEPRAVSQ